MSMKAGLEDGKNSFPTAIAYHNTIIPITFAAPGQKQKKSRYNRTR
ncbi:MAG: hypothetical protein KJ804_10550 [Proteobacteria bacterium]|nr:hypothetical protein [Pseudomonadota bacterium]MBU1058742.1 hypothetical protein [Pseudomonadota bacterium]